MCCGYPSNHQFDMPVASYNLDHFINNESIVDTDIVLWVHIASR